jgi:hypothetical protein
MNTTTEENSLRDALESSFETTDDLAVDSPLESTPSEQTYAAESEAHVSETAEQKAQREYNRDQSGKFAPKDAQNNPVLEQKTAQIAPKVPEEGIKAAEKVGQPPAQKDPLERAPQAWKPEAREFWKDIPQAARSEIVRHEQQVQQTLRETAQVRQFADAVQKAVDPYRGTIEAEGSNVVAAIGSLMQTAQALRTAPPAHKAQMVANMVKQFGIDVGQLDQALSGQVVAQERPEVAAMREQYEREFAPLRQMQQQLAQQQQMAAQERDRQANAEIAEFSRKAEFMDDVRHLMADLIDVRERNNLPYTLEDVYNAACQAHPEISRVMQQRAQAQAAQSLNNTAQRARQAAVSVGGSPALGGSGEMGSNSIRDSLRLAMDQSVR